MSRKETENTCGKCIFASPRHAGTCECRRFPPSVDASDVEGIHTVFPVMLNNEWCGEFKGETK